MTQIELIVASVVTVGLMLTFYALFSAGGSAQRVVFGGTNAAQEVREALDTMGDHLRDAQLCTATSGCVTDSVLSTGSASALTYYNDATGDTVRYFLSGTTLERTDSTGTVVVLQNVSSLTYTYYVSSTYNNASLTTTASPNAPTSAELVNLAAIGIKATAVWTDGNNSTTVQCSTMVRLRNSPMKTTVSS